jgi:hypothetical protein
VQGRGRDVELLRPVSVSTGAVVTIPPRVLEAAGLAVLRVTDAAGRSVPRFRATGLRRFETTFEGFDGLALLEVPDGGGRVMIADARDAAGNRGPSAPAIVEILPGEIVGVRLLPESPFAGTLVDMEGRSVVGALIEPTYVHQEGTDRNQEWRDGRAAGLREARTRTDERGRFRLLGLPDREVEIEVGLPPTLRIGTTRMRTGREDVVLRALPAVEAWIRVLDADGRPVRGGVVALDPSPDGPALPWRWTDANGWIAYAHLDPDATFDVTAAAPTAANGEPGPPTTIRAWSPRDELIRLAPR